MPSQQTNSVDKIQERVDACSKSLKIIETQLNFLSNGARLLGTASDSIEIRELLRKGKEQLEDLAALTSMIMIDLHLINAIKQNLPLQISSAIKELNTKTDGLMKNFVQTFTTVDNQFEEFKDFRNDNLSEEQIENNKQMIEREYKIQETVRDLIETIKTLRDTQPIVSQQSPDNTEDGTSLTNNNRSNFKHMTKILIIISVVVAAYIMKNMSSTN